MRGFLFFADFFYFGRVILLISRKIMIRGKGGIVGTIPPSGPAETNSAPTGKAGLAGKPAAKAYTERSRDRRPARSTVATATFNQSLGAKPGEGNYFL